MVTAMRRRLNRPVHHLCGLMRCFGAFCLELPSAARYRTQVIEQFYRVGIESIPLALTVAGLIGLATVVQALYFQKQNFVPDYIVGSIAFQTSVLELCPVLVGLMIAGRIGSGITAEIGTMKVSEQLLALEAMAINPMGYLVVPRVLAGLVMLPVVTVFADAVAVMLSYFYAIVRADVSTYDFMRGIHMVFNYKHIYVGLLKSVVFGGTITLIGAYVGLEAKRGARGVSAATTQSMVASSLVILFFDYFLMEVLL